MSGLARLPRLRIGPFSAFHVCGVAGLGAACTVAFPVAAAGGGSAAVMAAVAALAVLVFLALAMATKVVTGEERLTAYHHQLLVPAAAAVVLGAWHRPVLVYLDATVLGVGAFLAFGRVGCFLVGCCHGRVSIRARGAVACYGADHAEAGFSPHLVGVPVLAAPLLESAWVALVAAGGVALAVGGARPGTAALFYAGGYSLGRFWLETVRGDDVRPVGGGLSEAQWTSVAVALAVAGVSRSWAGAAAAVAVVASAIWWRGRAAGVGSPRHVNELADALAVARAAAAANEPGAARTPGGVVVSALTSAGEWTYAVSGRDAGRAAELVARLAHCPSGFAVVPGSSGVVHVTRVAP